MTFLCDSLYLMFQNRQYSEAEIGALILEEDSVFIRLDRENLEGYNYQTVILQSRKGILALRHGTPHLGSLRTLLPEPTGRSQSWTSLSGS